MAESNNNPTMKNNSVQLTAQAADLALALETERGLRQKAEEVASLVALRARTIQTDLEHLLAKTRAELMNEKELRNKAEEVSALVATRARENAKKLENQIKSISGRSENHMELLNSWTNERETLLESIKKKDIALSVLGSELGTTKEANAREVESLWAVVNKLDALDGVKDGSLQSMRAERDEAREALSVHVHEKAEMKKEMKLVNEYKRALAESRNTSEKLKAETYKLKKELREIDEQLLGVAEFEGVNLHGVDRVTKRGVN